MALVLQRISFTYESAPDPLFSDITVHFPTGWTGVVGANGTGKTTLLRLACGELEPQHGNIQSAGTVVYCPQRTDEPPALFTHFLQADDADACELRGRLDITPDWELRWATLSHGERKRAQIAVALWQSPAVLAIDEPTNHIDLAARRLLAEALHTFRGTGLLVSHDRELLDALCGQCLFVEPPQAILRPGGYTTAAAQARLEEESQQKARAQVKRTLGTLQTEAATRQHEAAMADKKRSKRKLARGDSDGRGKINLAIFTGKDGRAGRLANQLDGRLRQAQTSLDEHQVKKSYRLGFWLPGACSKRDYLFHLPAGALALGDERTLTFPELVMGPRDRIALTGANGAGKSSLVRHLLERLNLPEDKVVYLPQEIVAATARTMMAELRGLSDEAYGRIMTIVSGLGSRPYRLMESDEPSPGEIRKILLALGVVREPHLIIMDEPTNHLDLPAIECLESALEDCPCGLLLVSHDLRFLHRLATTRWHITGDRQTRLHITDMED